MAARDPEPVEETGDASVDLKTGPDPTSTVLHLFVPHEGERRDVYRSTPPVTFSFLH